MFACGFERERLLRTYRTGSRLPQSWEMGCAGMASFVSQPKCAICNHNIDPMRSYFRASGEFLPPRDRLLRFCNAPMHWECYCEWPERERFARFYVDAWVDANRKNPFWWSVYRDEDVYVSANPQRPIEEASVRLYSVGSDIRIPLPRWPAWLDDVDHVTPNLSDLEREELAKVLPVLREQLPTDHALVDAIDPGEKRSPARKPRVRAASANS